MLYCVRVMAGKHVDLNLIEIAIFEIRSIDGAYLERVIKQTLEGLARN